MGILYVLSPGCVRLGEGRRLLVAGAWLPFKLRRFVPRGSRPLREPGHQRVTRGPPLAVQPPARLCRGAARVGLMC